MPFIPMLNDPHNWQIGKRSFIPFNNVVPAVGAVNDIVPGKAQRMNGEEPVAGANIGSSQLNPE